MYLAASHKADMCSYPPFLRPQAPEVLPVSSEQTGEPRQRKREIVSCQKICRKSSEVIVAILPKLASTKWLVQVAAARALQVEQPEAAEAGACFTGGTCLTRRKRVRTGIPKCRAKLKFGGQWLILAKSHTFAGPLRWLIATEVAVVAGHKVIISHSTCRIWDSFKQEGGALVCCWLHFKITSQNGTRPKKQTHPSSKPKMCFSF